MKSIYWKLFFVLILFNLDSLSAGNKSKRKSSFNLSWTYLYPGDTICTCNWEPQFPFSITISRKNNDSIIPNYGSHVAHFVTDSTNKEILIGNKDEIMLYHDLINSDSIKHPLLKYIISKGIKLDKKRITTYSSIISILRRYNDNPKFYLEKGNNIYGKSNLQDDITERIFNYEFKQYDNGLGHVVLSAEGLQIVQLTSQKTIKVRALFILYNLKQKKLEDTISIQYYLTNTCCHDLVDQMKMYNKITDSLSLNKTKRKKYHHEIAKPGCFFFKNDLNEIIDSVHLVALTEVLKTSQNLKLLENWYDSYMTLYGTLNIETWFKLYKHPLYIRILTLKHPLQSYHTIFYDLYRSIYKMKYYTQIVVNIEDEKKVMELFLSNLKYCTLLYRKKVLTEYLTYYERSNKEGIFDPMFLQMINKMDK